MNDSNILLGKASEHPEKQNYIQNKRFICYLPTEFVAKSPTELIEMCGRFDAAYAYELKDRTYALEVWHNYGGDGHTEMSERGYIIVENYDKVPHNYEEYIELVGQ